jgi:CheY-like chemotaxis protein
MASADQVMGDGARLHQVFWNLLRNAVKFTPDGGDIIVRCVDAGDGACRVEVRDTGIGIPPEVLPRVFNAFEQGDVRVAREFGGMGLGLAITKAIVDLHAGAISAASDGAGRGAVFTVTLPASVPQRDGQASQAPRQAAASSRTGNCRLLLVEDHADTARMLKRLLENSGYAVKTVGTARAALQAVSSEPFDLVVSDVGLPDASGYELMAQLRDSSGLKGIAVSGYGTAEDLRKSREAGFSEHLVKPLDVARLEEAIVRVCRSTAGNGAPAPSLGTPGEDGGEGPALQSQI